MRRVRSGLILTIIAFPTLLGAASVTNLATCSGVTTNGGPNAAGCSGSVVYATAYGSVTQSGNTVNVSANTFSSYVYAPNFPQPTVIASQAETRISDELTTDGPLRAGLAEITFNDFLIQQNALSSTWAQLTISVNGNSVYSCFTSGGGMSTCPTTPLTIPIELGSSFSLDLDDISSSPSGSFSGGISTDLTVALLGTEKSEEADSVPELADVPEPGGASLAFCGLLAVFLAKLTGSRARPSRKL